MIQNTTAWHEWRNQGIGSSDIGSIMGLNKYKSLRQLWQEKAGKVEPSFEDNTYTQYGKHKEPYAIAEYEWQYEVYGFEPKTFVHPEHSFIRASFDAFHPQHKYGLEIKSPYNPKNIEHAANGKIDRKYYAQLQWLLLASETELIKYVVYDGSQKIWVKDVYRDHEYQRRMIRYARWFWGLVLTKTDPKRRKPSFIQISHKDVTE